MGRRLASAKPSRGRERRLWRGLPPDERCELWAYFKGLKVRFGPFRDLVVFEQARLVAELWFAAVQASGVALVESARRQRGRGRRPSLQALSQRFKRQALGVGSFDAALRRLEELATGNGHRPGFDLAAALARVPPAAAPTDAAHRGEGPDG